MDYYGNHSGAFDEDDDIKWQDNETFEPQVNHFSYNQFNHRGNFRPRGGYGPVRYGPPPRFFGPCRPPPRPQGPPFMRGRGFGHTGPAMHQQEYPKINNAPMRYLIRCGVPKPHLSGLPKVLLNLIKPEYCGLCAQEFDSFDSSRLHYISKNHLKNQRKWLAQKVEVGSRRPKEIPLKSRDLYCELCDVHITSKSHADSHYAGKQHRAIVDGRKNPKNPYLLQKGLQERVDQLIRREKRNLKPVEESEESQEVIQNQNKPVQPELYCEICKTAVTCSEQMTMHLNGKRHLSKEKQHILKVMKGDTPAKEADKVQGECAKGEQKQDVNVDDDDGDGDDNYDWGKGSGTWDDDPQ